MTNPTGDNAIDASLDGAEPRSRTTVVSDWLVRRWAVVVGVLSVLTSLAGAVVAASSSGAVSFADESDYLSLSTNLVDAAGYTMDGTNATAFRPPGFPVALSLVAWAQPHLTSLRVANAVLAGLVVLLGALLAKRLAGRLAAVIAAVGLTVSPIAVYTATKLYPQTLAAVLMIAAVTAIVGIEAATNMRSRLAWSAGAGLALAALTLTVPNHGITLVAGGLWLLWRLRAAVVLPAVVLLIAFSVPIGAWAARNYVVFDEVVPVSTNGGINLLLGNTDGAGAGTGTNVDISEYVDEANRRDLDEVAKDHYFQEQGIDWIVDDPVGAGRLYAAKVLNTFSIQQELATEDQQPSMAATLLVGVTYLPVLLLFLIRPFARRLAPLRRGEGLLIAVFWANVAATAVAFTRIRFRVPIDPLMTVVVATFLASIWSTSRFGPSIDDTVVPTDDPESALGDDADERDSASRTPTATDAPQESTV